MTAIAKRVFPVCLFAGSVLAPVAFDLRIVTFISRLYCRDMVEKGRTLHLLGLNMPGTHAGLAGNSVLRFLFRLLRSENAAIGPMFALLLIPIAGSIAYAVELGGMYYVQRSIQNAADAAAIAAASNNNQTEIGTLPQMEARAAAQPFGYVHGDGDQTVTAALTTCPTGVDAGGICYEAVVTDTFPLSFSRLVGFFGTDGTGSQLISARAVAIANGTIGGGDQTLCAWTLSSETNSFTSNGGPRPDLDGCSLLSNGGMTCNGHDLGADYGIAAGTSSGCGSEQVSDAEPKEDPYAARKTNIPANPCGGTYHQLTGNGQTKTVNAANRIAAGTPAWSGTERVFCGDVQLQGNVTLTGTTTLVIENGRLDLRGWELKTASGAKATIVYTGNNGASYHHYPMSSGGPSAGPSPIIDIVAPSSGPWKDIAMYGDPDVTTNTDFTYAGNSPAWEITGIVYFPNSDVTFSGVVNKASDGTDCFVLVTYTLLVNGTAQIFENTGCGAAGIEPPTYVLGSERVKLVL